MAPAVDLWTPSGLGSPVDGWMDAWIVRDVCTYGYRHLAQLPELVYHCIECDETKPKKKLQLGGWDPVFPPFPQTLGWTGYESSSEVTP